MTATRRPVRTEGRTGCHPPLVPGPVDDRHLDLLDGDRVGVDAEHAGGLARRRAQAPGELGEVVGGVQAFDGGLPVVAVDEVVPVRDEVAERAAVVAERDAAVHAARPPGPAAGRPGTARTPRASRAAGPARAGARGSSRPASRNPVGLPMGRRHDRLLGWHPGRVRRLAWPRAPAGSREASPWRS